ncbi:unnamed protein product [Symbiodinium sp. CCMP2592]|nr:unnamed protein product [Symbiodinium sp. CCMP2592]
MIFLTALLLIGTGRCDPPRLALEVGVDGDIGRPLMRSKGHMAFRSQSDFIEQGQGSNQSALQCREGIQSPAVCCPSSCGTCGGPICALLPGGSGSCCFVNILASGRECSSGVGAPCVVDDGFHADDVCDGIPSTPVCCPASCGSCGGEACSNFPGGSENCCHRPIVGSGRKCSADTAPPCAMYGDSFLHPPATVAATTATMTSTSTTTTTGTTTTITATTTTRTVTTSTFTTTTITGTTTTTGTSTATTTTITLTTTTQVTRSSTTTTFVTRPWTTQGKPSEA